MATLTLFCCGCATNVYARLTTGEEIYPHRSDLHGHPFWKCDTCYNYVGCHHKTALPTRPLGNIPTAELRKARQQIHAILDPLWKTGKIMRGALYAKLAARMGLTKYHTGEIRTIHEAREVYLIVINIRKEFA